MSKQITLKQIVKLLPATTSLVNVDYRENLDEHFETLQKCIVSKNYDPLHEKIDEWFQECIYQGKDYIINELKEEIETTFGLEEEEIEELIEDNQDELTDIIYSRCDDNVVKDLLRNTSGMIMHYDTGHFSEVTWASTAAERRLERITIKKLLNIKDSIHDNNIDMMIMQASYGGQLLIFFTDKFEQIIEASQDVRTIEFKNASIGIIDHCNGSGDVCDIPKHTFKLGFNNENVFFERSIKYNWSYAIAGMCNDWCNSTEVNLLKVNSILKPLPSSTNIHLKIEASYNETYKKGECTFGDMDYDRHRDTYYVNNNPCGNICPHCHTFWVD